jgi:integrase
MKGSIQKHIGKTGTTWYAVVDLPADPVTGKRRQKRLSAPTRRECEALVVLTLGEIGAGGTGESSKITVREFLERWIAAIEPTLRPSTFRRYRDLMRLHVTPAIGGINLGKLAPLDIQRLYADRLEYGLPPTTVNQLHNVLHEALKQAMRWGTVSRNVTEIVDAPRPANPESKTWDAKQVTRVLTEAVGDEFEALWRIALMTGMRRGELLGLTWADVDLDRGVFGGPEIAYSRHWRAMDRWRT